MDPDLQKLLEAWLSDDLDPTPLAPLIERIKSDDDFREAFVAELTILGQLKAVQSSEPRWLKLEDLLSVQIDDGTMDASFEDRVMNGVADTHTQADATRPNWPIRATAGALAAAALAAGLLWIVNRNPISIPDQPSLAHLETVDGDPSVELVETVPGDNSDTIAVLSQSVDAQWAGQRQHAVGDSLVPGDLVLTQGTIQIEFLAGVRLLLRAPADIQLRAADEVLLRQGTASCYVTEMGRGFKIVTKEMEVIDLGTAFSIAVDEGHKPQVHVLEGAVEIKSPERATLKLEERQAIQMGDDGPERVAYSPDSFPKTAELRDLKRVHAEQRYEQWKSNAATISADPSVLLHYTFEEADPSALEITNHASDKSRATEGVVIGCQWSQGRWPSKRALLYRNASDRVLFQVPGFVDAVTFLAWVRIDALTQRTTSLLMTEHPGRRAQFAPTDSQVIADAIQRRRETDVSTVRWEIAQHNHKVLFSVGHGPTLDRYDLFASDHPSTHSDNWGHWTCLAVTCDVAKRETIHYFNGQPIGTGRFKRNDPLLLDFMELGNFGATRKELETTDGFAQRRFYGAIDEVVIAERVFDAEEIKSIWIDGQP